MNSTFYPQGCGVGLRPKHYEFLLSQWPKMDWFEAISENYMDTGGRPIKILEKVRAKYPIALHGTSLSIGTTDPLNKDYLKRLRRLIQRIDPFVVSDHLCWSSVEGHALHDLLPLPFTQESLNHLIRRVSEVQEFLGRPLLLENVSTYVSYQCSTISEWEFLAALAKRTGCGVLLDINNLYVNSFNHGFDPEIYLEGIPHGSVGQIHLAGHTDRGKFLFDTHSTAIIDKVWRLYEKALKRFGQVSTLIEWDEDIPDFPRLAEEAQKAREIYVAACPCAGPISYRGRARGPAPSANNLRALQAWMRPRIQPHELKQSDPKGLLNPQAGDPGIQRMEIYASGYLARMYESLKECYETIYRVLGEELFRALAFGYAQKFPSRDYNLSFAGRHLPEFLKDSPLLKDDPCLYDLAVLEWKIIRSFHAFDQTPMNFKSLERLPAEDWESIELLFQPSVALLQTQWPVLDLWLRRCEKDQDFQNRPFEARPQSILIGRKDVQVRTELLDKHQYQLLRLLLVGKTLGEACESLAEENDKDIPMGDWFHRWVSDGLIAGYKIQKRAGEALA